MPPLPSYSIEANRARCPLRWAPDPAGPRPSHFSGARRCRPAQAPDSKSSTQHSEVLMPKEELIEMNGAVTEVLPDSRYRVTLDNGHQLIAYSGGKMRKHHIRILAGDKRSEERRVGKG